MDLLILNFGYTLSDKCKSQLKDTFSEAAITEVPLSVSFDVKKNLYPQVVSFLNDLTIPLDGSVPYIVNVPNLPIISMYILSELYARAGVFPKVIELIRDEAFGIFILKRIVNLEYERRMTRNKKRKYQYGTEQKSVSG